MYAFTEMMNNAIEHAKAKNIRCRVIQDALYTEISIADDGIGNFFVSKVFRKFAIWSQVHVFVSDR
jgi:signal transduction histidine kinase